MKKIISGFIFTFILIHNMALNLYSADWQDAPVLYLYKSKEGKTVEIKLNRNDYEKYSEDNDNSEPLTLTLESYNYNNSPSGLYDKINIRRTNEGLVNFRNQSNLGNAAYLHSVDMIQNGYLSSISLDGRTTEDRIRTSGYNPLIYEEYIAAITFINFMPLDRAENIFVDNLFAYASHIMLNPNLKDIGIGLVAGAFTYGGETRNAYILTCDFATSHYPEYINIGSTYSSGINNSIEFWYMDNGQCMHGYATCRGWWRLDPCNLTELYCSTEWEYNIGDFYPENNCDCF